MTFNGLPLHPLVVHAVVVLAPLGALAGIAFALVPRWRAVLRWPVLVLGIFAAAGTWFAASTGDSLKHDLPLDAAPKLATLVEHHEMWAGRLQTGTWVMGAVWIVAFLTLPVVSSFKNGRDRSAPVQALVLPVQALLVLVGIAVLVLVALTGDAGAKAVWDGVSTSS